MRKIYWKNLEEGERRETEAIDIIKKTLNLKLLIKDAHRFSPYDFRSDVGWVEYRTRTCNHDTYSTTMIPASKVLFSKETEIPCFIFIQFNDLLTYWEVPKNFNCIYQGGGRCDRGENEFSWGKKYCYLPVSLMTIV